MEMESEMERGAQSKQNLISKIIFRFFSVPELWTLTCNMPRILYSNIVTILIKTTTALEYSMWLLFLNYHQLEFALEFALEFDLQSSQFSTGSQLNLHKERERKKYAVCISSNGCW